MNREGIEEWKDVPGWECLYQISSFGRVLSCRRGRNLTPMPGRKGYLRVALYRENRGKFVTIHSLVLLAFVGPRPKGLQGCHLDGNNIHNYLSNLAYGTPSENELQKQSHGNGIRGSKNPKSKLSQDQVSEIRSLCSVAQGVRGYCVKIARRFAVDPSTVRSIRRGATWKFDRMAEQAKGGDPK